MLYCENEPCRIILKDKNGDSEAKTLNIVSPRFHIMEFSGANVFGFGF